MKMKKYRFHTVVTAAAALLTAAAAVAAALPLLLLKPAASALDEEQGEKSYSAETEGPILRLHVIANSDSAEDQRVKLLVRDAVLAYEREREALLGTKDASESEADLLADGGGLYGAVKTVLESENCGYDAQLMLGDFDFPDRKYGGELYPAGTYRALRIVLGNGGGQNWWCILFPPLCIINDPAPTSAPEPQQSSPIRFESLLARLWRSIWGDAK